jgi:hypothetical protein
MPTLQFPTPAALRDYWNAHKPKGAPDEPVAEYVDYLEAKNEGETWDIFIRRVGALQAPYQRAADVTMAIFGDKLFRLGNDSEGAASVFDELLADAAPAWRSSAATGLDVWIRWCQLSAIYGFLPESVDEKTADFVWSRVRCFIAGAGYENHAALARELCSLAPGCALVPEESRDEWEDALLKAHATTGWPAQLGWLQWTRTRRALGETAENFAPRWLKMVALLHLLKHARMSPTQEIVVHYNGVSSVIALDRSNAFASAHTTRAAILAALDGRGSGKKQESLSAIALRDIINLMEHNHLLRKTPLVLLPPNILAGPWTMGVPEITSFAGFYQTGLRMSGLWSAVNGKISRETLDQPDVLAYDWNCKNPANYSEERALFRSGLPSTYEEAWPSDIFIDAFPNYDLSWCKDEIATQALKALLDVPVAASLLRHRHPELSKEFPAIVFMPADPSPQNSTNQGKSQAALVYARATNPSITRLVSINDSSSAPDIRTVAGEIRTTGSIAVDEFRPPKNQTHILAHDNMQSLCTGSSVASGRVYENEGTVAFRSSPVFSAKVYEVPPDIQNRSLAHWLGPLTDEMRSRSEVLDQIRTGATSLRMRLGMHAILEKTGLAEKYAAMGRQSSARGLRFDAHRTLACALLVQRTEKDVEACYAALDHAFDLMQRRLRTHVQAATDSGLVAAMEFGTALKLRASYLFDGMTIDDFKRFKSQVGVTAGRIGAAPKDILTAWSEVYNIPGRPYSEYVQVLTGSNRRVSNRAVLLALTDSMNEVCPNEGDEWLLPGEPGCMQGWKMVKTNSRFEFHSELEGRD